MKVNLNTDTPAGGMVFSAEEGENRMTVVANTNNDQRQPELRIEQVMPWRE